MAGAEEGRWNAALAGLPRGRGSVRLEISGRVAELVLDNAEARNAVSVGMMRDLAGAVARLRAWTGAAVILRSADGQAFCSGGDLAAVRAHLMERRLAAAMSEHMQRCLDALAALPLVRIAAVQGAAVGGGAEILMVADWILATPDSRVGFVHARLGVSPGWGGGRRLVARVGPRRARLLLAGARTLSASQAHRAGLVDEVDEDALAQARALAATLATRPPDALAAALRVGTGLSAEAERAEFLQLWGGAAHRTALAAVRQGT